MYPVIPKTGSDLLPRFDLKGILMAIRKAENFIDSDFLEPTGYQAGIISGT
jgi:hypothetical protein